MEMPKKFKICHHCGGRMIYNESNEIYYCQDENSQGCQYWSE